jgi:hypothetical protein
VDVVALHVFKNPHKYSGSIKKEIEGNCNNLAKKGKVK